MPNVITQISDSIFHTLTRTTFWRNHKAITKGQERMSTNKLREMVFREHTPSGHFVALKRVGLFRSIYTQINIQNTTITLILPSYHNSILTKALLFLQTVTTYYGPQSPWYCIDQEAFSEEATLSFPDSRLMLTWDLSPVSSCFCWLSVSFAVRKRPPHPLALFNACKCRDSCK